MYFYKKAGDETYKLFHSLIGTFIKDLPEVKSEDKLYYPLKILLPGNKSRLLYFDSKESAESWNKKIREVIGYANLFDFYDVKKTIAKGTYGLVNLAIHKSSGQ